MVKVEELEDYTEPEFNLHYNLCFTVNDYVVLPRRNDMSIKLSDIKAVIDRIPALEASDIVDGILEVRFSKTKPEDASDGIEQKLAS